MSQSQSGTRRPADQSTTGGDLVTDDVTPADLARWAEMHTAGTCSCQPWPCPVRRLITLVADLAARIERLLDQAEHANARRDTQETRT